MQVSLEALPKKKKQKKRRKKNRRPIINYLSTNLWPIKLNLVAGFTRPALFVIAHKASAGGFRRWAV